MDIRLLKKMRRHRRLFRLRIFVGVLVGGILSFHFIPLVFNPSASILYNGVPTTAFGVKLSAALIAGVALVLCLGLLLLPARTLDRAFVRRQHALSAFFSWMR
jgi:hypothetical protein